MRYRSGSVNIGSSEMVSIDRLAEMVMKISAASVGNSLYRTTGVSRPALG